jgi:HEAT repeat protein
VRRDDVAWSEREAGRYRASLRVALLALLGHDQPAVRRGTLLCCEVGAKQLPQVLDCLADPDAGVREAACVALERLRLPAALPALLGVLSRGGLTERLAAVRALRATPGDPAPVRAFLERSLSDEASVGQRLTALGILEAGGGAGPLTDRVRQLAAMGTPTVRAASLRVLATDPNAALDGSLLMALHDADEQIALEAIELVSRRGGSVAVPHLVRLLTSGPPRRRQAIRALGQLGVEAAVLPLAQAWNRLGGQDALEIVAALTRIGGGPALRFLRARLADGDQALRRAAADGLARHASDEELDVLEELAQDRDWGVRRYAALGLGRLATAETAEPLLALARDPEPVVAHTAQAALARLRPPPRPAVSQAARVRATAGRGLCG